MNSPDEQRNSEEGSFHSQVYAGYEKVSHEQIKKPIFFFGKNQIYQQ